LLAAHLAATRPDNSAGGAAAQLARCLASCEAVATGLRANFRAGLLAATLYFDGGCGDGEMRAARRQLEAYLQHGPQVTTLFDSKPMHVALSSAHASHRKNLGVGSDSD